MLHARGVCACRSQSEMELATHCEKCRLDFVELSTRTEQKNWGNKLFIFSENTLVQFK